MEDEWKVVRNEIYLDNYSRNNGIDMEYSKYHRHNLGD